MSTVFIRRFAEMKMVEGKCHCGNVSIAMEKLPKSVTSCNCSICNRLGALWGYYHPTKVDVTIQSTPAVQYSWARKHLVLHHCPICSCTTHYKTTEISGNDWIGVNFRMMGLTVIDSIPVRRFDGADSWCYVDQE